jgi:hypothetical protein
LIFPTQPPRSWHCAIQGRHYALVARLRRHPAAVPVDVVIAFKGANVCEKFNQITIFTAATAAAGSTSPLGTHARVQRRCRGRGTLSEDRNPLF